VANLIVGFCIGVVSLVYGMANFPTINENVEQIVDTIKPSVFETFIDNIKEK
jgi:hypothetical protein